MYHHLMSMETFTLIMNMIFIRAPKFHKESDYNLDLDLLTILYQSPFSYPRRSGMIGKKVTI